MTPVKTKPDPVEELAKRTLPEALTPEVLADLRRPFTVDAIRFKPQVVSKTSDRAMATFYVDARLVAERLNHVVGAAAWSPTYKPIMAETNAQAWMGCQFPVECTLTVLGVAKADVGVYTQGAKADDKAVKSAYSDSLKRAAVMFGIGAYLYGMPKVWAEYNRQEKKWTPAGERALKKGYTDAIKKLVGFLGEPIDHGDLGSDPDMEEHAEPEPAGKPVPAPPTVPMASKEAFDGMCELSKSVGIPRDDLLTICRTEKSEHGGYRQSWLDEQTKYLNELSKGQEGGQ